MKEDLNLICGDEKQIVNKVQIMEAKYKSINLECGKTGEGLTEGTMEFKTWESKKSTKSMYDIYV